MQDMTLNMILVTPAITLCFIFLPLVFLSLNSKFEGGISSAGSKIIPISFLCKSPILNSLGHAQESTRELGRIFEGAVCFAGCE